MAAVAAAVDQVAPLAIAEPAEPTDMVEVAVVLPITTLAVVVVVLPAAAVAVPREAEMETNTVVVLVQRVVMEARGETVVTARLPP